MKSARRATWSALICLFLACPAAPARGDSLQSRASNATSLAGSVGSPGDWPQQYFDERHSSYNRYETEISPTNVVDLVVAWASPLQHGETYVDGRAGPIVIGDTVYAGTRSSVFAMDVATGARLWTFPVGDSAVTGIAVWRDRLLVTDVLRHAVYALDRATGQQIWQLSSGAGTTGPVVVHGLLIYNDFLDIHAVDVRTGDPVWTTPVFTDSFAAVRGRTIYVLGEAASSGLHAIDAVTGEVKWTTQFETDSTTSVALGDHVAYLGTNEVSSNAFVHALDLRTHQELWQHRVGSAPPTPSVANGLVYVNDFDGILRAYDAITGATVWTAPTGGGTGSVAIANGVAYAASSDGLVRAYRMSTGELLWSFDPPGGLTRTVVVSHGTLYFGNDEAVFAMRLPAASR